MAIYNQVNTVLIQERNVLLRRLEELNTQIGNNTVNMYKKVNEAKQMTNENKTTEEQTNEGPKLSMQERFDKTKALLAQGKKNSEIAKELNCSTAYVYNVKTGKVVSKVSKK